MRLRASEMSYHTFADSFACFGHYKNSHPYVSNEAHGAREPPVADPQKINLK